MLHGRLRQKQGAVDRLGQAFDPRSDVYGAADGGELEPLGRADAADNGRTGVNADANRDRLRVPPGERFAC